MIQSEIEDRYHRLEKWYNIKSNYWINTHTNLHPELTSSLERKRSLISEYLAWTNFIQEANSINFTEYDSNILKFLTIYQGYIMEHVNI